MAYKCRTFADLLYAGYSGLQALGFTLVYRLYGLTDEEVAIVEGGK